MSDTKIQKTSHQSSKMVPRTVTPDSKSWPRFSPSWAETAVLENDHDGRRMATFSASVEIASTYRDGEAFPLVVVRQQFVHSPAMSAFVAGEPWVEVAGGLWGDYRNGEIATRLRILAEVLSPMAEAIA